MLLEDPGAAAPDDVYMLTTSPKLAPDDQAVVCELGFEAGASPPRSNGETLSPGGADRSTSQRRWAARHGVGRVDMVENRLVGMKSRGIYETPGGTIVYEALRSLRSITMERDTLRQAEKLSIDYTDLVYTGRWFHPLRVAMDAFFSESAKPVTGIARVELYKGTARTIGVESEHSLYREELATFGAGEGYSQKDSEGFVKLYGLPGKVAAMVGAEAGK